MSLRFVIFLAIVLAIAVVFFKSSTGKGLLGEFKIKFIIGRTKDGKKYVYNNYKTIINDKSSQIDHIVVNKNGVFVIETKNYSGIIYGSDQEQKWTQVLAGGNVQNEFYNPVKQNKTHIYQLSQILPKDTPIVSIVVFAKNNAYKVHSNDVYMTYHLRSRLKQKADIELSEEKIKEIAEILNKNKADKLSNSQHIQNINKMKSDIENNICPRCSSPLVLREGKYGEFYGCSNYPKCKFIKKIDEDF